MSASTSLLSMNKEAEDKRNFIVTLRSRFYSFLLKVELFHCKKQRIILSELLQIHILECHSFLMAFIMLINRLPL